MARTPRITLVEHLSSAALAERYRQCHDAKEARRWHALWLFSTGQAIGEIAGLLGLHRNWVRTVIKRYNTQGPAGVLDGHHCSPGGRRPYLNKEQEQLLADALEQSPPEGGIWSGPKVAAWIAATTGRSRVTSSVGWVYLRKLNYSRQLPRPCHSHSADEAQQAAWKKN